MKNGGLGGGVGLDSQEISSRIRTSMQVSPPILGLSHAHKGHPPPTCNPRLSSQGETGLLDSLPEVGEGDHTMTNHTNQVCVTHPKKHF